MIFLLPINPLQFLKIRTSPITFSHHPIEGVFDTASRFHMKPHIDRAGFFVIHRTQEKISKKVAVLYPADQGNVKGRTAQQDVHQIGGIILHHDTVIGTVWVRDGAGDVRRANRVYFNRNGGVKESVP